MARSNYSNDLYKQYEEQFNKNVELTKEIKDLKLEIYNLKQEVNNFKKSFDNKLNSQIEKLVKPRDLKIEELTLKLNNANEEIKRLKNELGNTDKDYIIDKLTNQVNKDSTNSSIPTSKVIINKHKEKTGANIYNHREKSGKFSGGQLGHKGETLTKDNVEKEIKENSIKVIEVIHYIKGSKDEPNIIKYKKTMEVKPCVEKHIFIHDPNSKNKLPREFYSEVTYGKTIKTLVIFLGNYLSLGYSKIKEFLYDLTDGFIDISEGTIDNIYEEFSNKTEDTINNITINLKNSALQHTDEITTKVNGKEGYYRGYANKLNVIYKYHNHKGDDPIKEDDILTNFFGTIISDHEVGIFKYGTNNQDCVIHTGRYCNELTQNIYELNWPQEIYYFLLQIEINRKILEKFGRKKFTKKEIDTMYKEYNKILEEGQKENELISSKYWKEKANKLLKRLIKYKETTLFYLHDFSIPYDNNFIERALRMIKSKTKNSGGFRSINGAIRFGNIMSVIKTAKLRGLNPFDCIEEIYEGKTLFA